MNGRTRKSSGSFRFLDLFIIVLFLSIAAISLNLFWLDLTHTINLKNVEPVGTVVIKKNTVQRRHSDRVLWDRLASESPVYVGDLIRIAEISAATLSIEGGSLDLYENTLIRISLSEDGEGLQIVMNEGSISFVSGNDSRRLNFELNGRLVQTGPGAVLSAEAGRDGGISVQVNEGTVSFIEGGGPARSISSGTVVAMGAGSASRPQRAAVVTQPVPNARYVKSTAEPFAIIFSWNRINLAPNETLRLEIASDRNFTRIAGVIDNLGSRVQAQFDAGFWYWRLLFDNTVLSTGRLTIADGTGPRLNSPAVNSLFRYRDELPLLNFQWAGVEEAVSYIFEVSNTPDFAAVQIRSRVSSAFITAGLGQGTWFWRVMPVFPPVFSGSANFSAPAFFRVEQAGESASAAETVSLSQWLAAEAPSASDLPPEVPSELIPPQFIEEELPPEPEPEPEPEPPVVIPVRVSLSSPAQGAQIAGLTALRQQTVFRWDTDAEAAGSRFVLSRNANPLQGQPARVIQNPARVISIDRLSEGTWYWTVEVRTADGLTISATPRRLQVMPIPLLLAPQNLIPARGTVLGLQELSRRTIAFRWQAVQGANAYIFTLYQQNASGTRRQIMRTTINSGTSYTFDNMRALDRGTFVWQVEAVNVGRGNTVEQTGNAGESTFVINFPSPSPVQIEDTGILYGN